MKFILNFVLFFLFISCSFGSVNDKLSYSIAVDNSIPAVVSIQTQQEVMNSNPFYDPMFRFFDPKEEEQKHIQQNLGSGIIVDEKGYILTNNHVVKDAVSITVKLFDGQFCEADIIGTDARTDLAVLKLKDENIKFPVINFGDSSLLKVGDIVLAIGNPFGFDNTVTQGIVSALGSISARSNEQQMFFGGWLDNLIQTDAAINPGNSGGALVDVNGNLIGINVAIISKSGGSQGIGFAIPINLAKRIMYHLIFYGYVIRGWLGAHLSDINDDIKEYLGFNEDYGVYIKALVKNGPAELAGLLPGDVIIKINNNNINCVNDAIASVSTLIPDHVYTIEIFRHFKILTFLIKVIQVPSDF